MEYVTDYKNLPDSARGAVIAIGNFDGVHKGHRALIDKVRDIAAKLQKPAGVLTFEPHPRRLFRPDDPPFLLTPAALKARLLKEAGIDIVYALPFTWDFASLSAEAFMNDVLRDGLAPSHIVVGTDFCFGQLRKGTAATLKAGKLPVTVLDKIADDEGDDISASAVRRALRGGDVHTANALLGWEWEIEGTVVKGDQRGRQLGYPTANVPLNETLHPAYGVYASWVKIAEDGPEAPWMMAATNIGIRPMFELKIGQVESYIFDFDRDIYGKTLRVRPVKRLRGEAKFDNIQTLIAQIGKDCEETRATLKKP